MKRKKIIIVSIVLIIITIITCVYYIFGYNKLKKIKYDVLVMEHYYKYEDSGENQNDLITPYIYMVIDSKKSILYEITYMDIKQKTNTDKVTIKETKLSKSELKNFLETYSKDKYKNIKDLIDKNTDEEYELIENSDEE